MSIVSCSMICCCAENNTKVMVLYPEQGISQVQKHQMTSMSGSGIHVVGMPINALFIDISKYMHVKL